MKIDIKTLKIIMLLIKDHNYPKSKQVDMFIKDVLDHFGEVREGQ